ncbi:MAG: hypothetical protein M1820_008626 [Bogoriella megaspora]|nr:MAG: hypothetical protein M1820_008626 [Bogoriella megaspora]
MAEKESKSSSDESPSHQEKAVVETSKGQALPDPDEGLSEEERRAAEKKLLRKLDWTLIPWLTLLYLVAFLDRTNIGNANVDGLSEDLHLSDTQYAATLSLFFVSYSLFEPLTNILLKRYRPKVFLTVTMTLWGVVMTLMGLVTNYAGLAAARWFLGLMEAGLFPGINFYLSAWYKRSELGIRAAIFFSAAALSGSFGGLLAAAIALMDGISGKHGWAWIFILEGLATVILGVITWWIVQDFPAEATFLSDTERARVLKRLREDNQASSEHAKLSMRDVIDAYKDWKTYAFAIIYMGCDGALYAFSLFTPSVINALGYTSTRANLLSVPPYAAAAILTVTVGWIADKTGRRGIWNILCSFLGIAGFAMQIGSQTPGVKYAAVFLGALGIYPCIANTIAWTANNVEGVYKRGVVTGTVIGWGNLNGVVASEIYRNKDKPKYYPGHGTVLGYLVVFLLGGSVVTELLLMRENRLRKAGKRDYQIEGKTEDEIAHLGDQRPDFIYTL